MSSNSIPSHLKDLLSKANFISSIKRGEKPNVIDMTTTASNSWFGWYTRWKAGECKRVTITFIERVSDELIRSIIDYKDSDYLYIILDSLDRMKIGINNLNETTYKSETIFTSRAEVVVQNIDLQLSMNREKINSYRENYKIKLPILNNILVDTYNTESGV